MIVELKYVVAGIGDRGLSEVAATHIKFAGSDEWIRLGDLKNIWYLRGVLLNQGLTGLGMVQPELNEVPDGPRPENVPDFQSEGTP